MGSHSPKQKTTTEKSDFSRTPYFDWILARAHLMAFLLLQEWPGTSRNLNELILGGRTGWGKRKKPSRFSGKAFLIDDHKIFCYADNLFVASITKSLIAAKASSVFSICSSLCAAVGISRIRTIPLGTTG